MASRQAGPPERGWTASEAELERIIEYATRRTIALGASSPALAPIQHQVQEEQEPQHVQPANAWRPLPSPQLRLKAGTRVAESRNHPNKKPRARARGFQWSGKRDSNSRPRPWQGRALPTELFPRNSCFSPIPENGGLGRNRTGVHGFAGRCMTTLPPGRGGASTTSVAPMPLKRLAVPPKNKTPEDRSHHGVSWIWSGKRDSNSRPRPWQGRALPTELFPRWSPPL